MCFYFEITFRVFISHAILDQWTIFPLNESFNGGFQCSFD